MKNKFKIPPFILSLFVLIPFITNGQSFNHVFHPGFYGSVTNLYQDSEGIFYIESINKNISGWGYDSYWLTKLNSSGETLLHIPLAEGGTMHDAFSIPSFDDKIITLFNSQPCDLGWFWQIKGLDQNGLEEWLVDTYIENWNDLRIFPHTDASFCIQSSELLYIYNFQGGLMSEEANNLPILNHYTLLPQGQILAFDPHIAVFEQLAVVHENQSLSGIIDVKILADSNGYAAINQNELFVLDNSLNLSSTFDLSNYGSIIDFDLASDGFWLLFENQIINLDFSFNLLGQTNIPYSGIRTPKFILKEDDRLLIAGDEVPIDCATESQAFFIQAFEVGETISFMNNVSVLEVWTPTTPVAELQEIGYEVTFQDLHLKIGNEGVDTIRSVYLDGRKGLNLLICQSNFEYNVLHENLIIAPGESLDINIGDIIFPTQYYLFPFNMCFWAIIPNGQTDFDRSDNCLCKDFEVIVSNKDITNLLSLTISPNPNSGQFTISGIPENISRLKIYNAAGICVYDALPLVWEGTADIMLSQKLAPGVYFLVTNEEHSGSLSRKFILQNL